MGRRSKEKGIRGEREFAKLCREHGYEARRGQQYNGIDGEDVVGLPGIHVEVKRTEALRIYDAMEQAKQDANGKMAIVAHRKNGKEWLIVMCADDWFEMFREYHSGQVLEQMKRRAIQ